MSKMPILFLPGLLCDDYLWKHQSTQLSDVADSRIADLTLDDSVSAMAARALAGAPERFALVSLSMGGYVAFEILRQVPERVTHLALFDTSAGPDSPDRIARRKAGIESLKIGRFAGVTTRLLPQLVHATHVMGPVGDAVRSMAARVGQSAYERQQKAILGRPNSLPLLESIRIPTLVAVGDEDMLTPIQDSLDLYRGIEKSTFHVFKFCRHLPVLEQPDETTKLLRGLLGR